MDWSGKSEKQARPLFVEGDLEDGGGRPGERGGHEWTRVGY